MGWKKEIYKLVPVKFEEEQEKLDAWKSARNKEYAMTVCREYIARHFSQAEFKTSNPDWYYKLNIRPNKNQNASVFWNKFIQKLYTDGEALIILSDTNDLLVADHFLKDPYALYQYIFKSVRVENYVFERNFLMDDVFYCSLNNPQFNLLTDSLYEDYGKLMAYTLDGYRRKAQLKGKITLPKTKIPDKSEDSKTETFVEKIKSRLVNDDVAIWTENENIKFEEIGNSSSYNNGFQSTDIDKLFGGYLNKVALTFGIPPVLLVGEQADSSVAKKEFYDSCLEPLFKMVESELNGKLTKGNSENKVNIIGPNKPNIFQMAESIDKLIASGSFNRNEIRELLGYDPVDGLDEFVITKNYQQNESALKGGDNKDEQE